LRDARPALARMQIALVVAILVVAAGVAAYAFLGQSSSQDVSLSITETDPVNQSTP